MARDNQAEVRLVYAKRLGQLTLCHILLSQVDPNPLANRSAFGHHTQTITQRKRFRKPFLFGRQTFLRL